MTYSTIADNRASSTPSASVVINGADIGAYEGVDTDSIFNDGFD